MKSLEEILKDYKIKNKSSFQKSERAEIIKKFVDRLNADRIGKYEPLPASVYAIKMAEAGLKTNTDLYWFYRYCDDAKNFSRCWWWALKAK